VSALAPTVITGGAKKPAAALSFYQWLTAQTDRSPETDEDFIMRDLARDLRDDPAAKYLGNYELRKYLDERAGDEKSGVAWRAYQQASHESLEQLRAPTTPLVAHDLIDFKAAEFPTREPLVRLPNDTVVFSARSLNQIFAWRGTGKTMMALSLAGAMAIGGKFLNLQTTRPSRVLYFEGESPNAQMQERSRLLIGPTAPGFFRLITLDSQPNGIQPLSSATGRQALEEALGDAEVLFLDSISTLAWIPTNDEEEWLELLAWFARLRSRGLCVIFLHHAGKSGLQRGHSRSEDMLDVSLKLSKPPEDDELDYLRFRLEFDKFRGERTGIRSLVVECRGGLWSWALLETEKLKAVKDYLVEHPNASSRAIARALPELGSHATIAKLIRQLDEQEPEKGRL
jgi:hypothetical protein